ncbi:sensor histidine kinase [Microcoleus sp. FACHB-672]|nr:sensor histidine kinase [Microcoleus sp. FACHB-672]
MLMPASSEFVALCRAQLALLTQGLRASLSVVYLTEELVEGAEAKLIPIAAYPETAVVWEENAPLRLLPERAGAAFPRLLSAAPGIIPSVDALIDSQTPFFDQKADRGQAGEGDEEDSWQQQRQIILPLMHEGVVMGLLVTSREDRPWNKRERSQIERIAHTLALACILDQRSEWSDHNYRQQQLIHAQQHDILDNLLHQLRSPLTALKTFGKLLLRRLLPGDGNRDIASSIVRESDRLQELLQQMDRTIDQDRLEIEPAPLAVNWEAVRTSEGASRQTGEPTPNSQILPLLPASPLELCSVAQVLEPLLISARAIAGERLLSIITGIVSDLPPVPANPKALREVLSNLIDNALKYTPAGGQIYIQVEKRAGGGENPEQLRPLSHHPIIPSNSASEWIVFSISDTGPGIPPQDLERLFERHFRGVQAEREIPGTGLGLAIAKDLVEQMQGEIQVFSPAKLEKWKADIPNAGPGTMFVLWLPVGGEC